MARATKPVDIFQFSGPADILACLREMVDLQAKFRDSKPIAALTAVVAWSIADWVHVSAGPRLGFASLGDFQIDLRRREPVLGLLQGFGNAFKHGGSVDHPTRIISVTVESYFEPGVVEDGYISDELFIEDDTCAKILGTDAFQTVLTFWEDFFRQNNL